MAAREGVKFSGRGIISRSSEDEESDERQKLEQRTKNWTKKEQKRKKKFSTIILWSFIVRPSPFVQFFRCILCLIFRLLSNSFIRSFTLRSSSGDLSYRPGEGTVGTLPTKMIVFVIQIFISGKKTYLLKVPPPLISCRAQRIKRCKKKHIVFLSHVKR